MFSLIFEKIKVFVEQVKGPQLGCHFEIGLGIQQRNQFLYRYAHTGTNYNKNILTALYEHS